ncbi:rab-like protein 6 isoform X2 [Coregonus clupeaformis]|uniref:rab-like protein 6 isoform X2 n=1 Tax=Coregonus clupeaformis TaxID=59861 RepID=UPI001E1C90B5|nr:rab-like protein 6 isoform X2 [Coregonus clupeaformis]
MFSALKKLVGTEPGQLGNKNIPAGLQSMNQSLQRRFAKGVQYNMKIIIRGDRNTGKSALWHRLQGKKFLEEYIPTQEIQVSSIHWNYKTTDDVVKVEVWDVVDKGKGKKRGEMLKTENEPQENETEMALDAEFLDVYKNCNGVIMMFDITKQWTFDYIVRELPKVPTHVPICVLGNQRDMGEHRVILPDDTREFLCHLNRPPGSSYIHYAESSMKNGFGLKYLHRFFNIPFLQLQRETLLRQLETNQLDIDATLEELNVQQETEDQNYGIFLEMMEARNKAGFSSPGGPSNGQSPSSGSQSPIVPQSGPSTPGACPSPCTPQQPPLPPQPLTISNPTPRPVQGPPSYTNPILNPCPPLQNTALPRGPGYPQQPPNPQGPHHGGATPVPTPQSPSVAQDPPAQKRGFMSRLFGSATPETPADGPGEKVRNVDDFVPDVGVGRSFLEEGAAAKAKEKARKAANMDSDSDGEGRGGNPMVSGFQDDFAPDELCQSVPKSVPKAAAVPSMGITLTSDEEDEGTKALKVIQDGGSDRRRSSSNALKTQNKTGEAKKPAALKMSSEPVSFLNPTPAPVQSMRAGKKKGGDESSHSGQEAPVADQMLSFVMDEPDCEDKEFEKPKKKKEPSVVLEYLEPVKPSVLPIKSDNLDLFGLGFQEVAPKSKESSEDQDDRESRSSTKDKKKKKKKSKEEDDKSSKKRHKQKKKEESGSGDEKEKKKNKSKSTKKAGGVVDDLESFLAGDEDYEEM